MPTSKKQGPPAEAAQEEMTVVVFRLKGGPATMAKGFDAVTQAFAALGPPQAGTVQRVIARSSAAALPPAADTIDADAVGHEETQAATADAEDTETVGDEGASRAAPRERRLKPPKFDDKLDPAPFKVFAGARNPKTLEEKYLVACLWLQEESGLAAYGGSQIYTCFTSMSWPIQVDFTQVMRTMKKDKKYFLNDSKRGEWRLNPHGLDVARNINHSATA